MKTATRILRVVKETGPRKRTVLAGLAEHYGERDGEALVRAMARAGELVVYGQKRGATLGAPDWKGN